MMGMQGHIFEARLMHSKEMFWIFC